MRDDRKDRDSTFCELVEQITTRLRPVCANMPETEFRELVAQMAHIELKYIRYPYGGRQNIERGSGWPGK